MDNRRLSNRILLKQKIKFGPSKPTLSGYTFNISESGIGIRTNTVLPPKSMVLVDIYMGDKVVRVEGMIAWVSSILPEKVSTMGIRLTSRTDDIKRIYETRSALSKKLFGSHQFVVLRPSCWH
jgi:PilZ domain-containing protein